MVPVSWSGRHPLLLGRDDVERQHRQDGAVHRHRDAHLVQRDAVEELPHVQDRVDRDARHADVAGHPRVVGVVAAVGGQVEGDRQALLPGGEVAPVERVGLRRGGEARRTAGPSTAGSCTSSGRARAGTARCPGRCPGSPARRRSAGGEQRRDGDALGRLPGRLLDAAAGGLLERLGPVVAPDAPADGPAQLDGPEVGDRAHACTPTCSCTVAQHVERVAAGEHVAVDAVDRRGPACRPATPASRRPPAAPAASPAADSA